jgi:Arc/MetJ family transcription regulator
MPHVVSNEEKEHQAQIRAHTFMFGCGNGGRDVDEYDPTEAYHAETEQERRERLHRKYCLVDILLKDVVKEQEDMADKKAARKRKHARYKENKRLREEAWRKEQQASW